MFLSLKSCFLYESPLSQISEFWLTRVTFVYIEEKGATQFLKYLRSGVRTTEVSRQTRCSTKNATSKIAVIFKSCNYISFLRNCHIFISECVTENHDPFMLRWDIQLHCIISIIDWNDFCIDSATICKLFMMQQVAYFLS